MKTYFTSLIFAIILIPFGFSQSWIQKNNFPGNSLWAASGLQIGNRAFMTFGSSGSSSNYNETWEYDQPADTWVQVAPFPGIARRAASSFSSDSLGYAGLGWDGTTPLNDFFSYNPVSNTWSQVASFPGTGARNCFSTFCRGKGYVGGGAPNTASTAVSDFWEYDPISDTWTSIGNFPFGVRATGIAFSINGIAYFGLGLDGSSSYNDLWSFDPSSNTWSQMASFPGIGRLQATCFVLNGRAIVGGGYQLGSTMKLSDYFMYDPSTNTWSPVNSFANGARAISIGFSAGKKGYIATGQDGTNAPMKDVWEYSDTETSIEENIQKSFDFTLFPVPSTGTVNIRFDLQNEVGAKFEVFNTMGQIVHEQALDGTSGQDEMDLSGLPQGGYFYRISTQTRNQTGSLAIQR